VLQALARSVTVVKAASAEGAVALLASEAPFALVLLDLGLPGLEGRAAFEAVKARAGDAALVLVTAAEPTAEALEYLRAGARGYVHKRVGGAELLAVLRFVLQGGTHIPQVVLSAPPVRDVKMTPRQREVLTLLARGAANKEIAAALGISDGTVRVHVSSVMRVLGVENRTQAATSALARTLVEPAR
jgi:DNA-binding NarL/FixJ family response regulator